jgi:imidazole glycerol-phosphate synthase subunit HisH
MINIFKSESCNISSIKLSLKALGMENLRYIFSITDNLLKNEKIILPGVSSFDSYISSLETNKNREKIISIKNKIIGICAGAQVLFESSEEGSELGLGLLQGRVKKIVTSSNIKVPHLGWNKVILNHSHPMAYLFDGIDLANKKFYFSHSYRFPDSEHALAYVDYGERFPVVIAKDNLIAIQFHPEKSYKQGLQFLNNICNL